MELVGTEETSRFPPGGGQETQILAMNWVRKAVDLELLYLDGCTSWHQVLENLRPALRSEGMVLKVSLIRVLGAQHAKALRFRSCPTIRLGGVNLFPEQLGETGLSRRLYPGPEGLKEWPTVDMIKRRLRALRVLQPARSAGGL